MDKAREARARAQNVLVRIESARKWQSTDISTNSVLEDAAQVIRAMLAFAAEAPPAEVVEATIEAAAQHVLVTSRTGTWRNTASDEQIAAEDDKLLAAYRDIITKALPILLTPTPVKVENDVERAELAVGKAELLQLLDSIWRAEYRQEAPNWKPLDYLAGMGSQIDNMYAGVRSQRDEARWALAAEASPAEVVARDPFSDYYDYKRVAQEEADAEAASKAEEIYICATIGERVAKDRLRILSDAARPFVREISDEDRREDEAAVHMVATIGQLRALALALNESGTAPVKAEDDVERVARALCDDPDARRIAKQEEAPCFEDSSPHVQAYWRVLASAMHAPDAVEAATALASHKWLDPECIEGGCQSLVWKSRYEAAVKGRQDFRRAYKEARAALPAEQDCLREALEPFANAAVDLDDAHRDNGEIWESPAAMSITAGDLRRARAALNPSKGDER